MKDESNFSKDYSVVADMALDLLKSRDQKCWGELTGYTRRRTLKDSFLSLDMAGVWKEAKDALDRRRGASGNPH